jgi:hypothetical protein
MEGFPLDVPMAPAAVLSRISAAMQRSPRRLLGLLRVETEFRGFVRDDRFEVWDRYRHAVRGYGRVIARRGGSRIELRAEVTQRTYVMSALFFLVYAVLAVQIASTAESGPIPSWAIAGAGAVVTLAIFAFSARQQARNLGSFVRGIFRERP